jgi:predicted kinase
VSVTLSVRRLPRGGKLLRVRVRTALTRFEVASAVIHARKQDEEGYTRRDIIRYMKRMMEENGTNGFLNVYNDATEDERIDANLEVARLFPELNRERN